MNQMSGKPLWDSIERAARASLGLDARWEMCDCDLHCECHKAGQGQGWHVAKVQLGIRVPKQGRQKFDRWQDIRKVIVTGGEVKP